MNEQPELYVTSKSPVRGTDVHGGGYYGASRGSRKHKGIDIICGGGTLIRSASAGVITRQQGVVYSDPEKADWHYVEVTDVDGVQCRYFYVQHFMAKEGQDVSTGDIIGIAQGIEMLYRDITPHIHFETRMNRHSYLDPNEYLKDVDCG